MIIIVVLLVIILIQLSNKSIVLIQQKIIKQLNSLIILMRNKKIQSSLRNKRNAHQILNLNDRSSSFNLQQFINFNQTLYMQQTCLCKICNCPKQQKKENEYLKYSTTQNNLQIIIKSLVSSGNRSLKLFIPDICFFENGVVKDFCYTNLKDNRIKKDYSIISQNNLASLFNKYRTNYLDSLRIIFENDLKNNNNLVKQIHQDYYNTIFPSYCYEGLIASFDSKSIGKQRKLVLHKNSKAIVDSKLEPQDKTDQYSYVCRYKDNNFQLFNDEQFKFFLADIHEYKNQISYIKSYIKPRNQNSVLITEFNYQKQINRSFHQKAELEVAILLQQISAYDQRYINPEYFNDYAQELKSKAQQHVEYLMYRIISFLKRGLKSTKYLKIRWIVNELNHFYMFDILEWYYQNIQEKSTNTIFRNQNNQLLSNINSNQQFFIETFKSICKNREASKPKNYNLSVDISVSNPQSPNVSRVRKNKPILKIQEAINLASNASDLQALIKNSKSFDINLVRSDKLTVRKNNRYFLQPIKAKTKNKSYF